MSVKPFAVSFAFHVPDWVVTRTFSLLGQTLLQFFASKLGNPFTLSCIQGKTQESSGEPTGTPWKVGGSPAWVKAEHGQQAITSTASLKTSLHAKRGFLCGHRRSETQDCKQAGGRTDSEIRDVTSELSQPAPSQQWSWRSCLCLVLLWGSSQD